MNRFCYFKIKLFLFFVSYLALIDKIKCMWLGSYLLCRAYTFLVRLFRIHEQVIFIVGISNKII